MAELKLSLLVGSETKDFLADLTAVVERLEAVGNTIKKGKAKDTADAEEESDSEEDEDFAPKPKKSKKANSFDEDEEEAAEEEAEEDSDDEEEEEKPAPKKAKKAKKVTSDDVNDACKKLAKHIGGKDGIAKVKTVLKKKFKTDSVANLEEDQYAACIKAMEDLIEED